MKRILTTLSQKWPEYLLEILVITVGILGAFALNSWNEGRQINQERKELIVDLIEDFEYNHQLLVENKIKWSEAKIASMDLYFEFIGHDEQRVSMDSLKDIARIFFRFETFNPNLTAYQTAESTGSLALLDNNALLEQFTLFTESFSTYQMVNKWSGEAFFQGSLWELRKQVQPGTIYNSIYSNNYASTISFKEYQLLMRTPLAQNALRNAYVLEQNSLEKMRAIESCTNQILTLLNEMKGQ